MHHEQCMYTNLAFRVVYSLQAYLALQLSAGLEERWEAVSTFGIQVVYRGRPAQVRDFVNSLSILYMLAL